MNVCVNMNEKLNFVCIYVECICDCVNVGFFYICILITMYAIQNNMQYCVCEIKAIKFAFF